MNMTRKAALTLGCSLAMLAAPTCTQAQPTEAASTTAANPLPQVDRDFVRPDCVGSVVHGNRRGETRDAQRAEFDKAYAQKVGVEGHKDVIAAFQKEIADGQNADIKQAAQKALPTVEEHYRMSRALAQKVGG